MTSQAPAQTAAPAGPRWLFQSPDDPTNVAPLFVEIIIDGGFDALTRESHDQTASREAFRTLFHNFFATDDLGSRCSDCGIGQNPLVWLGHRHRCWQLTALLQHPRV